MRSVYSYGMLLLPLYVVSNDKADVLRMDGDGHTGRWVRGPVRSSDKARYRATGLSVAMETEKTLK